MNETTAPHVAEEPERLLVRPTDDRMVAGVCSGLARYFDMSPLVYRVAFAALVLLGGAGLVLYAAAWLVIPDERRGASVAEEALRDRRSRPWLAVGVGLVGLAVLLGVAQSRLWPDAGDVWLVALAIGLAVVWGELHEHSQKPARNAVADTGGSGEPPQVTRTTQPLPAPPPRPRLPIFALTIGVLVAAVGVLAVVDHLWDVDIDWTLVLAGSVILVGISVAAGAFFGRTGALAVLGVAMAAVLAVAVTADLPLEGPIGERAEHPTAVQDLEREYRLSIGQLTVDLRDVELPAGATVVDASVGVGELIVYVPDDARVVIDGHVQAGGSEVLGIREDGWDVRQERTTLAPPSAPTLELDAEVGFGDLEVRRR